MIEEILVCKHNILLDGIVKIKKGNMRSKETVCFNIKSSWHAISRMYNEQAMKYGLTVSIGYVLLKIDTENGTPATKIGPQIGMESRSLTRTLKHLEEEGLIKRVQDSTDKRLVRIVLTDKGKEKKEIAKKVVKRFNQMVKDEIPPEQLETFFDVLAKIHNIIAEKKIYK